MHIYKGGPDVRKGLYDALHKANIPQPTIQMLTNEQDVSYLGMNISRKGNIITLCTKLRSMLHPVQRISSTDQLQR
jgi:hypothetical protein